MYQELLKDWIKTIPNKANRKYLQDRQELRVFAEWLDQKAAQQSVQRTATTEHVFPCGDPSCEICDALAHPY